MQGTSSFQCPQVMKIPDAKAAMDKEEKKKLETVPALQLEKVKKQEGGHKRGTEKRKRKKKADHLASLMTSVIQRMRSWNHNSRKYKGRVVLRGDIVKGDTGAYAVFSEQGSSASQMTAAKSNGYHLQTARVRRTSTRRSICLHPG